MARPFLSDSWYRVAPLRSRLRGHVKVHRHRYRGQAWYVLEDEARGNAHRFTPGAYLFIVRMDGRATVDEIWTTVAAELGEDAPSQDDIVQLLAKLHAADVMQCDIVPDVAEMLERRAKQARAGLMRTLKGPLSVRLPLWDPDRFLNRTLPLVQPLLGRAGALVWLAAVLAAAVLAGQHWTPLTESLSDRLLTAESMLLFVVIYPLLKALHELGHGYVVKRFGGEVHEMGIMFLVFFPVPYVDASSANAFASKRRRALVAAAGIMVELFVAALALFAWLMLEPGMARAAAYNVMMIAGISTLLFNGNPLLRFDGYYVLADLIEIPNLATRSTSYYGDLINRYVFRTEDMDPFVATRGERIWFLFYAPAAYLYRLFVLFTIVLFVGSSFFLIGVVLAIWAVAFGVVLPALKLCWTLATSARLHRNRRRAVAISAGAAAAAAMFILLVPLPLHTTAEGVVWLDQRAQLRAGTSGFVERVVARPGQRVRVGDPLVEMALPSLDRRIGALRWQVTELERRLRVLEFEDRSAAELVRLELAERRAELAREAGRADDLLLRAEVAGDFEPRRPEDLPGRFFHEGQLVGHVLPEAPQRVRVVVTQENIELVRHQRRGVEIMFPDRLGEAHAVDVLREVPAATAELPSPALGTAGGGEIVVDPRDPSRPRALEQLFQFELSLPAGAAPHGARVYVRFEHDREPIAERVWRRLRQLFLETFYV